MNSASAARKPSSRGSSPRAMRGAPRRVAAPVAKTSSVSLVEVSPSMVMALKLSSSAGIDEGLQHMRLDGRVGE